MKTVFQRGMGILPMSLTGVPPVSVPLLLLPQRRNEKNGRKTNHGQDARETHGRDAHATFSRVCP